MEVLEGLLASHGYLALFVLIFADQAGLPFPGEVMLLGAGALGRHGTLGLPGAFALAVAASLLADLLWYWLGRRHGARVLGFLCRLSLEPDSCVRETETLFERRGPAASTQDLVSREHCRRVRS